MAAAQLSTDPLINEAKCSKELKNFANIFNQHRNTLELQFTEIHKLAANITAKTEQHRRLDKIE